MTEDLLNYGRLVIDRFHQLKTSQNGKTHKIWSVEPQLHDARKNFNSHTGSVLQGVIFCQRKLDYYKSQVEQPIKRMIQLPYKPLIKAPNLQQNVSFPFHFSANFRQQKNNPLYANLFFPWNRVADRFNNINLVSLIVLRSFLVGEIGQKLIDHN